MSNWLKAGLVGAVIVVVLKVLQQIPCVNCCAIPGEWIAYGCIGALAAYWMLPARMMGPAAGQGALAAVIAALIGGIVGIGVSLVGATVLAPLQMAMLRQMPPEIIQQMLDAGLDPSTLSGGGVGAVETITGSAICCGVWLVVAAGTGAVGGVIYAAVKSE